VQWQSGWNRERAGSTEDDMEITPIGWLLVPMGILLAATRPRWLYLFAVFLLPFTATAVINIGEGEHASGVQASLYLGSLLLVRTCILLIWRPYIPLPRMGLSALIWMGIFVAIAVISLVMPIWIDGHIQVPSPRLLDNSTQPLYLRSSNITGVLYVVLGFGFTSITVLWSRKRNMLNNGLKAFLAGSAFAAAWAIVELGCKITGIAYPAFLFNTSASGAAHGYREVLEGGIPRLSSVSVEPSVLAQTLLIAVALYLPFIFGSHSAFGKVVDRCLFVLMLLVLFLSTSSTAYLGIVIGTFVALSLLTTRRVLRPKYVFAPFAGFLLLSLLYATVPVVRQVAESVLFSKAGGYSALERLMTVANAYDMFKKYPILGIGWSSIASHDLIVNILANCGVVGLTAFLIAIYCSFRALYLSLSSRPATFAAVLQPDFASFLALAVNLVACIISGSLFVFPFFWFLCGFAIAVPDGYVANLTPHKGRVCGETLAARSKLGTAFSASHQLADS